MCFPKRKDVLMQLLEWGRGEPDGSLSPPFFLFFNAPDMPGGFTPSTSVAGKILRARTAPSPCSISPSQSGEPSRRPALPSSSRALLPCAREGARPTRRDLFFSFSSREDTPGGGRKLEAYSCGREPAGVENDTSSLQE